MNAHQKVSSILYVEDNPVTSEQFGEFLAEFCDELFIASNGLDGLNTFKNSSIDIVVTDIRTPSMNGIEMVQEIRKIDEDVKIIFITAFSQDSYLKEAIELHADGYFIKPVFLENVTPKLLKVIQYVNNKKELAIKEKELMKEREIAQVQRDKAIASEKVKSDFLAVMSHEIRTPLNAIVGFLEFVQEENTNKSVAKYLDTIQKSSNQLVHLVEDILDFSKIENGKMTIEQIFFNPQEEFELIVNLFSAKYSQKNISLELHVNSLPPSIESDPYRVRQVLSNLLSNALKFSQSGKRVWVDVSYKDKSLCVSVKDQGKGIDEKKLQGIFYSFVQEDLSTTRKYGGTGLGLTISKKLVQLLGGDLHVKSELGKGSEFYFCIPAAAGGIVHKQKELAFEETFENCKVLLVEDDYTNQEMMKIYFQKFKIDFDIANDGLEAIDSFKKARYDLILMDENMPNMNGLEAVKIIRALESKTQNKTPVVSLSANAVQEEKQKFLDIGFDDFMPKPLSKKKLYIVFKKYLGNRM